MRTSQAAWQHRRGLAPLTATSLVVPAAILAPAPTAAALAAMSATGLLAARQPDHPQRHRRLGIAYWSGGMLTWVTAESLTITQGLPWWGHVLALVTSTAPGAVTWWRTPTVVEHIAAPDPEPSVPEDIPLEVLLLGRCVARLTRMDRSPIQGARIRDVAQPAPGVATVSVQLPHGVNSRTIDTRALGLGIEAFLDRDGTRRDLDHLTHGAVQVEPDGITGLQITASWSRVLDREILPWDPPELPAGRAWLGVDDARADLTVPLWETGPDGKTSALHLWVVGHNGAGKSTTLRTLYAPGIISGCILLILVDGKGDSLSDLAPYAVGRSVARDADSGRQAIMLAYMIMVSRQQRLGTPHAWTHPTPTDPLVHLTIDECTTVLAWLTKAEIRAVCEIARMGRSVGVSVLQSGQVPLAESVIGETIFRSQARVIIGHGISEKAHNRITTQSGSETDVSLLGLPQGRVAVLLDGQVLARRAKVSLLDEQPLHEAAAHSPRATLHEADRTPHVEQLLALAGTWQHGKPQAVIDVDALLAEWTGDETTPSQQTSTTALPAPSGAKREKRGLRQLILMRVVASTDGVTRPHLVEAFKTEGGYSRSAVYKEINWLVSQGRVREDDGILTAALRSVTLTGTTRP